MKIFHMFSGNPRKFYRQLKQRIRKLVENHTQTNFNKILYYIELLDAQNGKGLYSSNIHIHIDDKDKACKEHIISDISKN